MKATKRLISFVLTLTLLCSLFSGVGPASADSSSFSLTVTEQGGSVTLALSLNQAQEIGVFYVSLTVPDGFTYQSHTNPFGFSETIDTAGGNYILDTLTSVSVPAGETFLTVDYAVPSDLEPGEYTFIASMNEAADGDLEPIAGLEGTSASATLIVEGGDEPVVGPVIDFSVTENGDTATAVIKLNKDCHITTLDMIVTPPEGFTYQSHTNPYGFAEVNNTAIGRFIWDNDSAEGITIISGNDLATLTYAAPVERSECEYTFTLRFVEVVDPDFEPIEGLDGETATASLVSHEWGEPSYVWAEDNSSVTATRACLRNSAHVETETVNTTSEITKSATCEDKGETTYTASFSNEAFAPQTRTVENIPAIGHDWGFTGFIWTDSDTEIGRVFAAAEYTCRHDESHYETVEATVTSVTTDPTCTEDGKTVYTAFVAAEDSLDGQEHSGTKEVAIEAIGHDWDEPGYTWAEDNSAVTAERVCKNDPTHKETETVLSAAEVTKEAGCEEAGEMTYTATFTNPAFETQTRTEAIPATGHTPGEPVRENELEPGCETEGSYDTVVYCTVCGKELSRETTAVPALGHDWGEPSYEWIETETGYTVNAEAICNRDADHKQTESVTASYEVITEATYDAEGLARYTATFTKEPFATQTKDVVLPKLGYKITVTDYRSGANCSIDPNEYYSGTLEFTVSSDGDRAVLVAVKHSEEDYEILKCKTGADGVHSYTIEVEAEMEIVMAFKGDVSLDGSIKASDATMIKRSLIGTYSFRTKLAELLADVSGDGTIKASDATMVARSILGSYTIKW